jgi:hypothetical protein
MSKLRTGEEQSILASLGQYKAVWYTSPVWLAVVLVFLSRVSTSVREVVEFVTASPLR